MAECFAVGIPPWRFWDLTYREIANALAGAGIRIRADHKLALWTAYQGESLARMSQKRRLPDLKPLLDKIDNGGQAREMDPGTMRRWVLHAAREMGAKVVHRKRPAEA